MSAREVMASQPAGLMHPAGGAIRLNHSPFVAVDRQRDATYDAIYRPQALYNRVTQGFHANNEAFLLQEVATNLPIYRQDTGPTDFHLHLPPGAFQLVLVTSGVFTFDYDGQLFTIGPGTVILQSAIVHRQLFYTWSGMPTQDNLKTPQTVVPEPFALGYSGKFLEAFITDPICFPNPTVVGPDKINEAETPLYAWSHAMHDRPAGAGFWCQEAFAPDALYRRVAAHSIKSDLPVYVRDLGIERPSGNLVTGHIIATDPRGQPLLPKSLAGPGDATCPRKGDVVIYRVIRGSCELRDGSGKPMELVAGDTVTASADAITLCGMDEDTQILRLGLLEGIERLRKWTPAQRDEIDGLAGKIITSSELRPLRTGGKSVGYLYD